MLELFLSKPLFRYKTSFLEALAQVHDERSQNPFSASMMENKLDMHKLQEDSSFQEFLRELENKSLATTTTDEGLVPETTFWLIGRDETANVEVFLGRVCIRHYLTERLRNSFGHLGYLIRPSQRGRGYGKKILALALLEAKKIVLDSAQLDGQILISCKADNIISRKIIESAGGRFEREVVLPDGQRELLFFLPL